jgi:hypothetical protein
MNILNKQKLVIIGATVGAIAGFFYWKEVGCLTGTCAIQSVWYNMTAYGLLMGGVLGSIIQGKKKK